MTGDEQVRAELVALLRYANKSEVARALRVTPQAVINWSQGRNTSPARLLQVRRLYGLLDTTKEAAPPEWAERLLEKMDAWQGRWRVFWLRPGCTCTK